MDEGSQDIQNNDQNLVAMATFSALGLFTKMVVISCESKIFKFPKLDSGKHKLATNISNRIFCRFGSRGNEDITF